MRKIIHVAANYPPRLGGLEKVVEELAVNQHKQGQDVEVITSSLGFVKGFIDRVKVTRLSAFEIAHTPIMPMLLFKLLRVKQNSIIHLHVAQAFIPEVVMMASVLKGFKYIAHVHLDVAPSSKAGILLKIYKPLILKFVLKRAKFVIVFSSEQKEKIVNNYNLDSEKVCIIPNGVGAEYYHDIPRELHEIPRLLFVGRLSVQKNLQQFLKALNGISEKFETHIVGDGDQSEDLKQLAYKLDLKNVTFHGRRDGKELIKLYLYGDIFILPSEREGMPLVLLEAMAAGLPVVGTDVTGIRDLVTRKFNGLLVPLNDTQKMRLALTEIIKDSEIYSHMSRNSYERALNFTWAKVAKECDELYQ